MDVTVRTRFNTGVSLDYGIFTNKTEREKR